MTEIIFGLLTLILLPLIVYVSAKLWTYGALAGRFKYFRDHPEHCEGRKDDDEKAT